MRKLCFLFTLSLMGCSAIVPDLSTICPYKEITQGVFGNVANATGGVEENVDVQIFTLLNGQKDKLISTTPTTRGGYQFDVNPSTYMLCAKNVCVNVVVPTGLVEQSAADPSSGLTWNPPVAVPPATAVGPCKYGS